MRLAPVKDFLAQNSQEQDHMSIWSPLENSGQKKDICYSQAVGSLFN